MMNNASLLDPLHKLLTQSQTLLQLGIDEDWVGLQEGVADYQQKMDILGDVDYLQSIKSANQADHALQLIAQIQMLHKELDAVALTGQGKIASELRQLMQADKAMDAYRR